MIKNRLIFKIFILISLILGTNHAFPKKDKMLDLVSEVIAKEVFKQMRIKFDPKALKTVKKELKIQKVPQNFLSYFSCQVKTQRYENIYANGACIYACASFCMGFAALGASAGSGHF